VNGLRSKWHEITDFIADHDVVVFTESKLDPIASTNALTMKGYTINRLDRNGNGGGVISYVRTYLKPTILCDLQERAVALRLECTITKIQIQGVKNPVVVLGVYRPPSAPANWFDNMNSLVSEVLPLGALIIMGDLNADLLRPRLTVGKALKALLTTACVKVNTIAPTRIMSSTASCLDIIAIDKSILYLHYEVGVLSVSDHLPVIASINFKSRHVLEPIVKRSLRKVNFDSLRTQVAEVQLVNANNNTIDQIVEEWYRSVVKIIDSVAPIKSFPWRRDRCPWVNDDIRQLMDKREFLVKKLKVSNEMHTCEDLKLVRKQIKSRIRREAKIAGGKAFEERDTKKAWNYIKSATFTHNRSAESLQDLALLNTFFANTVTAKDMPANQTFSNSSSTPSFAFQKVTPDVCLREIRSADKAAASGPDGLSGQLISELAPAICHNFSTLCNLSVSQGYFPTAWKRANITPIWKGKGSKEDPNNFRPISILPILARIFERLMANQLYWHCDKNNIIPDQQFGFRKRSSCEIALLKATDTWLSQVDAGLYVGAILIDLSKAFDSVPHNHLVAELSSVGCDPVTLQWFTSYLTNREQRVAQGKEITPWMAVTQGVPQGSSLSTLLFNIYIRNLPLTCSSSLFQFADDTTASEADKDIKLVLQRLDISYSNIKVFCNNKGLSLNASKTQLIIFKTPSKKIPDDLELLLDGVVIKPQDAVKLLGFNLDRHFTWGDHIDKVVKKCDGLIGALVKASPFLTRDLLRMAYVALIRTHLEYCSSIIMSSSPSQLNKFDVIQRKAARAILQAPKDAHSAPLLESLGLEALGDRRLKHSLSIIQNVLSSRCHPALMDFFAMHPDGSMKTPEKSKLQLGKKRFRVAGVEVYNKFLNQ